MAQEDTRALLVQQFRAPPFFLLGQEHTLEAIAGIQEDADSITTARREALEEAGLHLHSLECVATVWTMPGISTELRGNSAIATAQLARLDDRLASLPDAGSEAFIALQARGSILVIREALIEHSSYFDAGARG